MRTKIPKHYSEIALQISPTKGLVAKYIEEKPKKLFSKPVSLESKKKISKNDILYFNIAGTSHYVKTAEQIKKLRVLEDCCEVTVKHEWKNKRDEKACVIFYKRIKLGYIPSYLNWQIIALAQKKIKYKFYVCNLSTHDFEGGTYSTPLVIAVRQR